MLGFSPFLQDLKTRLTILFYLLRKIEFVFPFLVMILTSFTIFLIKEEGVVEYFSSYIWLNEALLDKYVTPFFEMGLIVIVVFIFYDTIVSYLIFDIKTSTLSEENKYAISVVIDKSVEIDVKKYREIIEYEVKDRITSLIGWILDKLIGSKKIEVILQNPFIEKIFTLISKSYVKSRAVIKGFLWYFIPKKNYGGFFRKILLIILSPLFFYLKKIDIDWGRIIRGGLFFIGAFLLFALIMSLFDNEQKITHPNNLAVLIIVILIVMVLLMIVSLYSFVKFIDSIVCLITRPVDYIRGIIASILNAIIVSMKSLLSLAIICGAILLILFFFDFLNGTSEIYQEIYNTAHESSKVVEKDIGGISYIVDNVGDFVGESYPDLGWGVKLSKLLSKDVILILLVLVLIFLLKRNFKSFWAKMVLWSYFLGAAFLSFAAEGMMLYFIYIFFYRLGEKKELTNYTVYLVLVSIASSLLVLLNINDYISGVELAGRWFDENKEHVKYLLVILLIATEYKGKVNMASIYVDVIKGMYAKVLSEIIPKLNQLKMS